MRWHINLQRDKCGRHVTQDAAGDVEGRTMVCES